MKGILLSGLPERMPFDVKILNLMMMRLDKFLADAGCGTRSEVKNLIRKSRVTVNGETEKQPDRKINEKEDMVALDGQPVSGGGSVWYLLHKPAGTVSATRDNRDRTVMDLLGNAPGKDLFPVGRLDKDTEGLLLITNDGAAAHRLLSPAGHVPKTYQVLLDAPVTEEDRKRFSEGLDIGEEKPARPAELKALEQNAFSIPDTIKDDGTEYGYAVVTITEGRFHQVKRMFRAVGRRVLYLRRTEMGPLKLDPDLAPGQFRSLTAEEIARLTSVRNAK